MAVDLVDLSAEMDDLSLTNCLLLSWVANIDAVTYTWRCLEACPRFPHVYRLELSNLVLGT